MSIRKHFVGASFALLTMISSQVFAAEWFFIGNTNATSFFVDKSSIKTHGNIKSCWTSHVYQSNKNGIDQSTNHMLVNCKDKTIGQDKWIGYAKSGDVVDSVVVNPNFEPASPESMADKIIASVCTGKFYGKPQDTLDIDAIRYVIAQMVSSK